MNATPSTARMLVGALAVLAVAFGVWAVVEWRSAAPPPPQVAMPTRALP